MIMIVWLQYKALHRGYLYHIWLVSSIPNQVFFSYNNKVKEKILLLLLESYLMSLAKLVLSIYRPVIIGVTGSVGKTTTKEMIAHVLAANGLSVRKTEGNLNADLGIALTVLGYDHSPAIYEWPWAFIIVHIKWLLMLLHIIRFPNYFVVEMGIDHLGDMKRMMSHIQPQIGVVTWIGEGHHLEFLKDPETIASEKGLILSKVPADGLAIIPAHDPNTKTLEQLASGPILKIHTVGVESSAEIARVIAKHFHLKNIDAAVNSFIMPKGRLQEMAGINDSILIDDSYNSSFPAIKSSLALLAKHAGKRKIAVLGDVLEQGDYEADIHQNIAKLAKEQANLFVAVGKRMKKVKSDYWFSDPVSAAAALVDIVRPGDIILVKGSQGMRMEKVSYALAADKAEATKRLPRQSVRWQQIPFTNP